MRLLNTSTFKLQVFFGSNIPYYAILSHRWEDEEVSLQDLHDGKGLTMKGFAKIKRCCAQAASDGWQYMWIDTCCIDKTNSVELSEAINSMYKWYRDAEVCYVYMSDVSKDGRGNSAFARSKWFTRGWTLQELLAPRFVIFFDQSWDEIGTKSSLQESISLITGIENIPNFEHASVAQKMSWASRRETTREEDMAYCLMGLFEVHMAPLYGEGKNAFIRLQLEILNNSDDESIFAWVDQRQSLFVGAQGLLANSPKAFEKSGDIQREQLDRERPPYAMTNKGLCMEIYLISDDKSSDPRHTEYTAPLNCVRGKERQPIALKLMKIDGNQYARMRMTDLYNWECPSTTGLDAFFRSLKRETVFVRGRFFMRMLASLDHFYYDLSVLVPLQFSVSDSYCSSPACCDWYFDDRGNACLRDFEEIFCNCSMHSGALMITDGGSIRFAVLIELIHHGTKGACILFPSQNQTLEETVKNQDETQHANGMKLRDRVSKRLEGTGSVSVALRWKGAPNKRMYEAEITFDGGGNLPWQDVCNTQTISRHGRSSGVSERVSLDSDLE